MQRMQGCKWPVLGSGCFPEESPRLIEYTVGRQRWRWRAMNGPRLPVGYTTGRSKSQGGQITHLRRRMQGCKRPFLGRGCFPPGNRRGLSHVGRLGPAMGGDAWSKASCRRRSGKRKYQGGQNITSVAQRDYGIPESKKIRTDSTKNKKSPLS